MNLANSAEQRATEILIDVQTEIKELVKNAVINVGAMITFRSTLLLLIDNNLKDIKNVELRETARKSLIDFAYSELNKTSALLNLRQIPLIVAISNVGYTNRQQKEIQAVINEIWASNDKINITNAFSQLGNSQAMVRNNQSLYGHSELVERYEKQQNMLNGLRKKTNLVVCDTHSDCSDRCFKWQGKVYSLDGTYGTTSDGRKYQPLENATNVIDKYGHKNGLLGYNCRHKLVPYNDGLKPIKVTREEQQKQDQITKEQRLLEREIRYSKDLWYSFKGVDDTKASFYRQKAIQLNKEYVAFCLKNNRVQYRSRLKI